MKINKIIKIEKYSFYIMMPIFFCIELVLLIMNNINTDLFLKWHQLSYIVYIFELYLFILLDIEIYVLKNYNKDNDILNTKDFSINNLSALIANLIIVFVDIICIENKVYDLIQKDYLVVALPIISMVTSIQFAIAQNIVNNKGEIK